MKNPTLEALERRKSVRVYDPCEIPAEERSAIINAALQAPTAGNMTLYTIIDVQNQVKKDALAVLCDNQPFIAKAPLVLVFLADWQRWYDCFRLLHGDEVRKPAVGDLWLSAMDAIIAAQNSVVAAESLGIGSCYIGDIIENFDGIRETLGLPNYVAPAAMLCFGYPTEAQKNRTKPSRFPEKLICHTDSYKSFSETELRTLIEARDGKSFESEVNHVYSRKWSQKFMLEMTQSMKLWLKNFDN